MEPSTAFLAFSPVIAERDAAGLPRRFEGVAYSGGVISDYGWYGDAAIDLASLRLPDGQIFALVDHDPAKRAGKLSASIADNQIRVTGEFFTATEAGREVAALFAEGAPWQMSVGIQAKAKRSDDRSTANVNGQSLQVHTLFTDAVLREVSFVPVGADPETSAAVFARHAAAGKPPGDHQKEQSMTVEELTARVAELEGQIATERVRADAAESSLREVRAATRTAAISTLGTELGREFSAEETGTLQQLEEAAFVTMAAALRSLKPSPASRAPAHLFREQATGGQEPPNEAERVVKARAKMINQVSGKAA